MNIRHTIIASTALLALAACGSGKQSSDANANAAGFDAANVSAPATAAPAVSAAPPVTATFVKVESRTVAPRLEVTGTLDPDERSEVASQTMGNVLAVNVGIGSRVKEGDVLVELVRRSVEGRAEGAAAHHVAAGLPELGAYAVEAVERTYWQLDQQT